MRISRPKLRKTSNRRAHRPDQRVYRSLRLNRKRRGGLVVLGWAVFVLLTTAAGLAWWWLRR